MCVRDGEHLRDEIRSEVNWVVRRVRIASKISGVLCEALDVGDEQARDAVHCRVQERKGWGQNPILHQVRHFSCTVP